MCGKHFVFRPLYDAKGFETAALEDSIAERRRDRTRDTFRFLSIVASLFICLPSTCATHEHNGHSCIHGRVTEAAARAYDEAPVELLRQRTRGSYANGHVAERITMLRRELEMLPELDETRSQHARQLQANAATYLARPWGGLRIHVEFVNVTGPYQDPAMTPQKVDMLQNHILPGVTSKLNSLLKVRSRLYQQSVEPCSETVEPIPRLRARNAPRTSLISACIYLLNDRYSHQIRCGACAGAASSRKPLCGPQLHNVL